MQAAVNLYKESKTLQTGSRSHLSPINKHFLELTWDSLGTHLGLTWEELRT